MDQIRVDLHCHTHRSPDSMMRPARLVDLCARRGIQRLAITDHNTIDGALEAAALDPDLIIVGEEIMTSEGELLGYYLKERVPPQLSPEETIVRLRDQGALISVSHPLDWVRRGSWSQPSLERILPLVDAVEVFNARSWLNKANQQAMVVAEQAGLPSTAGSDAHGYPEVGRAGLQLPAFRDAASMKEALGEAELVGRLSPPWVHLYSRYATWRSRLRLAARLRGDS